MTNITPLYWEVGNPGVGVSLHTYAWAIESFGGSRNASAEKRGDDLVVPLLAGATHTRKFRAPRTIDLPMWMQPLNPDGSEDLTMSQQAKMHANWEYLMSLVDVDGQFPLTKRFYDQAGDIVAATAMAEVLDPPEPRVVANDTLKFTLSCFLADPWFYEPAVSGPVGTIDVGGNAETDRIVLTMGPGRVTGADGNWIQFNGSGTVEIDMRKRTAKQGTTYVNGQITRNTSFPGWLTLKPGSNAMTGSGTISYQPAWK